MLFQVRLGGPAFSGKLESAVQTFWHVQLTQSVHQTRLQHSDAGIKTREGSL